jgi:hypothetical protein
MIIDIILNKNVRIKEGEKIYESNMFKSCIIVFIYIKILTNKAN